MWCRVRGGRAGGGQRLAGNGSSSTARSDPYRFDKQVKVAKAHTWQALKWRCDS